MTSSPNQDGPGMARDCTIGRRNLEGARGSGYLHLRDASCWGRVLPSTSPSSLVRGLSLWLSARESALYRWFSVARSNRAEVYLFRNPYPDCVLRIHVKKSVSHSYTLETGRSLDELRDHVAQEVDRLLFDEVAKSYSAGVVRGAYVMTWIAVAESLATSSA